MTNGAVEDADPNNRTSATGLYNFAESYRDCAERLSVDPPPGLIFEAPIEFLLFHAMELYLKAYLRSVGYSAEQLRSRKFGHLLRKLHAEAVEHGLKISRYPDAFFDFMDPAEPLSARYIATGFIQGKASLQAIRAVATELREGVGEALRAQGRVVRSLPADLR
jgi:hypothetical protein